MSEASPQSAAKPGTACLGCRRRKLKCSREPEGCNNCAKSDLPCVYPAPETTGSKRKRGPYRKDKAPRERHLEELVKYLEPKANHNDDNALPSFANSEHAVDRDAATLAGAGQSGFRDLRIDGSSQKKSTNSEDLVKDALIALTQSSVVNAETGAIFLPTTKHVPDDALGLGVHPPVVSIFEYWHLFVSRVDPLTKVIHCPTFAKTLISAIRDFRSIGPATDALLFGIYYAAVSTCTTQETRKRFGEEREVLLQRYGRNVEAALADNYDLPVLESLQALVIYIIAIRRDESTSNVRMLFSLAARMAQMIGLHEEPSDALPPFDAEIRRRLWWHICGLESQGAEEGAARSASIMEGRNVALPANLFDYDLQPNMKERPQPRTGCTDVYFVLLRFEIIRTIHGLLVVRKRFNANSANRATSSLKTEQRTSLEEFKQRFETLYLRYLDSSRPFDWLCLAFTRAMLIKARLIIDHPFTQVPTKDMSPQERLDLLQASVEIIGCTNRLENRKDLEPWLWYFRGWTQWHSLAIVIAELGRSTNKQFANYAWSVLDPILARWDRIYKGKRDEPAWEHVNTLIERARRMRPQNMPGQEVTAGRQRRIASQYSQPAQPSMQVAVSSNSTWSVEGQGDFTGDFGSLDVSTHAVHPTDLTTQPSWDLGIADVPFQTGCAPAMPGLEADFGSFDELGSIDFSAFGAVFGDTSWEYSSPNTDWSTESYNI